MELPKLMKVREVADLLRYDTKTLYLWISSGRLQSIRTPTNYIRVPREEVEKILDGTHPELRKKKTGKSA